MRPLAVVLALLLTASTAAGAPSFVYEKEYKAAVKLESAGDVVGALAAFEAIPVGARDYNTKLHIASCKKKLGRLKEAARDYQAIKADPKADPATVETAASDLDETQRRIPKVRVRLTAATTGGVVVTIDGEEVKPPVEHPVDPGEHEVLAKRDGKVVYERRVTLPESAAVEVVVDAPLAAGEGTGAPPQPNAPLPPVEDPPKARSGIPATPFLIAGGVLVVGSVVSFVLARSAQSDLEANCAAQKTRACDADVAGSSRMKTWEGIGWISGGVALASIGVGIVLVQTRPGETSSKPKAVLAPLVGSTVGVLLEGKF